MKKELNEVFTPMKREKLHEGIVSQIKSRIYSNKLREGEKLPSERELAEVLRVSRVVVREALRSLEQSGLIDIRPGTSGGAYVTHALHKPFFKAALDLMNEGNVTLDQFFEARNAIESFSVRQAAQKAGPGDIARLNELNEKLLKETKEKTKLRENNAAFHIAIADISGNPLIRLMVHSLLDLLDAIYPASGQSDKYVRNTYERHKEIIGAMQKKALSRCESLMASDTEQTASLVVPK